MKMSRPASAACDRCQMSVLSLSASDAKPSAYICTTDASSTRSSRYLRSPPFVEAPAVPEAVGCADCCSRAGLEHAVVHVAASRRETRAAGIVRLSMYCLTEDLCADTCSPPPRQRRYAPPLNATAPEIVYQ